MRVRAATEADLSVLLALGQTMHRASAFSHMPFDPVVLEHTLRWLIDDPDQFAAVAVGHSDIALGVMLAILTPSFFGPGLIASDLALYAPPTVRGVGIGRALVAEFTAWAKGKGAIHLMVGNSAEMPDDLFRRLLADEGYTRSGSIMYRTEVPDV